MVLMGFSVVKVEKIVHNGRVYEIALHRQIGGDIAKVITTDDAGKTIWTGEVSLETVRDAKSYGQDVIGGAGGLWDTAISDLKRGHHN